VHEESFYEMAGILGMAALLGLLAVKLRQPLIVAFIAVGVAVGPSALGWVEAGDDVDLFATLGIAVLLFLVGLKLDLQMIRSTGPVALATGLGQVVFTSSVGFVLALGLGMDTTSAVYVGVALTFSSTIIIVKLLSDKRELEDLHGRIAIGFLIVQDMVVVIVLIAVNTVSSDPGSSVLLEVAQVVARTVALLGGLALLTRYALPLVLHWVARSPELLVLFAVAWAVATAAVGHALGLSAEVGAFVAGVAMASTPFRDAIGSRLVSLRDFLLLFFFVQLGSQLQFDDIGSQLGQAAVLSIFVLVGNPLIVMVIMGVLRYRKRVSFLAGLTVAQISEFSLILAALGLSLGDIDQSTVSLITTVGLITIGLSTYLILYSHEIYSRIAPLLSIFERAPSSLRSDRPAPPDSADVVVYGRGRFGRHLVDELSAHGCRVVVVDFDPQQLGRDDGDTIYGDAEDPEFVHHLPATPWIVSTISRIDTNLALLAAARNPDAVRFDRMEPIVKEPFTPDDDAIVATNPLEMTFFLRRAGCGRNGHRSNSARLVGRGR
jgi:Kef-type K+ transport system membrane component KefB